jgi:hypothetical protein
MFNCNNIWSLVNKTSKLICVKNIQLLIKNNFKIVILIHLRAKLSCKYLNVFFDALDQVYFCE